ncbi:MAG: SOS response-associated peptidase [Chloroflexi bacterium]|nr:SOS response-associated peptidase [Chloroflexota bacterium]
MCGRYTLTKQEKRLQEYFDLTERLPFTPRYNIAPTQAAPVILMENAPQRRMMRWGLIPFWAKDETVGNKLINARSETLADKPSFRKAFERRRCLVIADGFFEWAKTKGGRSPVRIVLKDPEPFAMAGLWEKWLSPMGYEVESFTIITTKANDLMAKVHDRMPVILPEGNYEQWLDLQPTNLKGLQTLLRPCSADAMELYPVSAAVNNPRHDGPECVEPVSTPSLFG